jgi:CheY-like chemotaxis protein
VSERITHSRLKRRLLIVEDDDDLRSLLAEHFECVGYQVETAPDGNEAIAKAIRLRPDVIVLDLVMPGLDGWATMKVLRTYPSTRDIPLLACTGANEEGVKRARALGCEAIVRKPCSAEIVEAMVNDVLSPSDPEASDAS